MTTPTTSIFRAPAGRGRWWLARPRTWRPVVGLSAVAGGMAIVAGCFLPWATVFAGLVTYPGTAGLNGRILGFAGALIAAAGACHLARGSAWSRWTSALAGFAVLVTAALLLLRLTATVRSLGGDDMVILRGGPGLWVVAAGGLAAFVTLFLPSSEQTTLRAAARRGAVLAWAADPGSSGRRRTLQAGLGVIWILDGALQFQPFMFGRGFVTQVIDPAAMGSPAGLAATVTGTGSVILAHPAVFNAGFATIQLVIGVALLFRRTARAGLAGSVVWGLAVWWLGEALGGLFSGTASPLAGAPGAALLYAVIAVLIWPGSVLRGGRATVAWVILWAGFAALMFQPQVRAPGALSGTIAVQAVGEPGWLAAIDRAAASAAGTAGYLSSVIFAAGFAAVATAVFLPAAWRKVILMAGMALALAIWLIGENLGGLTTGSATDANTGPLLFLLIAAFWPGPWSADLGFREPNVGYSLSRPASFVMMPQEIQVAGIAGIGPSRQVRRRSPASAPGPNDDGDRDGQ
jgi:hypothetical protein